MADTESSKLAKACWDIVVAGGGISGLVASISLRRQGHKVTVLERAPDEQFGLQGFHYHWSESEDIYECLQELNIWEDTVKLAIRHQGTEVCLADSMLLEVLMLSEPPDPPLQHRKHIGGTKKTFYKNNKFTGISRGKFRHFLLELAKKEDVNIMFDSKVTDFKLEGDSNKISVDLVTSSMYDEHEKEHEQLSCDLLIGADGSRSAIRKQLLNLHGIPDILTVEDGPGKNIVIRGRGCDLSRESLFSVRAQIEEQHQYHYFDYKPGEVFDISDQGVFEGNPLPKDGLRFVVLSDKNANALFVSFYENLVIWIASINVYDESVRQDLLSHNPAQVKQGVLRFVQHGPWHEDIVRMIEISEDKYTWAARSHHTIPYDFVPLLTLPDKKFMPVVLIGDASLTALGGGGARAVTDGVHLTRCFKKADSLKNGIENFYRSNLVRQKEASKSTWFVSRVLRFVVAPLAHFLIPVFRFFGYSFSGFLNGAIMLYQEPTPIIVFKAVRAVGMIVAGIAVPIYAWRAYVPS